MTRKKRPQINNTYRGIHMSPDSIPNNQDLTELKQSLFDQCLYRLGQGIIDIEADAEHLNAAYNYAISTYRQRAQNSTQESYILFTIEKNVDTYTLPKEIVNVRCLYRRTVGLETGSGATSFDPFSSAILNTYLLNYNFAGGLATYDFYAGYTELTARMFGGYLNYTFDPVSKTLRIVRDFKGSGEKVLIWADLIRPESSLLQDPYISTWIQDFTLANIKMIIGEAREKFATITGPGGGTSLNGAAMKAEGKEMQAQLLEELRRYVDGSQPLSFIIG
jgi:hypothetical protein